MEYQALYNKYRPQLFSEVVGQTHVTQTLAREIAEEKVAHAYLFAGPRGTGKTTSARLLAKALNCQNPPGLGEPCNECDSCEAIVVGASFDVTELDAASHNSVDDIREIKVSVTTVASMGGAKRVFILDEAHMLSKAAANALLKTLEEPPDHVHFVLATTEPYKLLDTIRSRSQRFDFHPVSTDELTAHLADIANREGFGVEDGALPLVARHAAGSVRDSLSLLEQVAALGGGKVDAAAVNRALGLADRDTYTRLATAVSESDAKAALELVAALAADGVDLRRFISEAIGFFRGVFLAHYAPNLEEVADEPDDILNDWRAVAEFVQVADVIRSMDVLSDGLLRLREGREERLMTEITLLKLTRPEVASDVASLQARIDNLERRLSALARQSTSAPEAAPAASSEPATNVIPLDRKSVAPTPVPQPPAAAPVADDIQVTAETKPIKPAPAGGGEISLADFKGVWAAVSARVKEELGNRRHALFREARPGRVDGSTLVVHVPGHLSFHLEQMTSDGQFGAVVAETATGLLNTQVKVTFEADNLDQGGSAAAASPSPDPTPAAPSAQAKAESEEEFDKDKMRPAEESDPMALLEDVFGEIVDETDPDSS